MDNQDLNPVDQRDPPSWDSGFYETGATKPPKNNGGLLAIMLVGGIFLGSILNSLGLLGFQLSGSREKETENSDAISLMTPLPSETSVPDRTPVPELLAGNGSLTIHDSPEAVPNRPPEGGLSYQQIYKKNIDSVVSITCQLSTGTSTGSGVVLTRDGFVVTNAHVVEDADYISVLTTDETAYPARVVGRDSLSDLAVLKVDARNLVPAEFGNSDGLQVGDSLVAIGDPLGIELRGTMTYGIVSGLNRVISTGGRPMTLIQTDAALNSGNSGGPLINCYGQVVGINTMKISKFVSTSSTVEGIGFAIPSATVKEIVDQLIANGYVSGRPDLGMDAEPLSGFNQRFYHLPAGLYVYEVHAGSDAQARGFQAGDIILSIAASRISSEDDLQRVLYAHQVGDTVPVIFYRNGRQYSAALTLEQAR